jgi:hypothetical protein
VKRREFITLLGGTAVAWPLAARAQQPERVRRIGVLTPFAADDAEGHARLTAFAQGLQQLGWTVGQNSKRRSRVVVIYSITSLASPNARNFAERVLWNIGSG